MNPELLLQIAIASLRASPPTGLHPDDVPAFVARNREALLSQVARALPRGADELPFTRWRLEHQLARRLFRLLSPMTDQYFKPQPDLVPLVQAVHQHTVYEDRVLFPFLERQLPALAPALSHARHEHREVAKALRETGAALRRGGPLDWAPTEQLKHHFQEEEDLILGPALEAGLLATPSGGDSPLIAAADTLLSLQPGRYDFFIFPEPTVADYRDSRGARRDVLVPSSTVVQVIAHQPAATSAQSGELWLEFWYEGRRMKAYSYGPVVPQDEEDDDEP